LNIVVCHAELVSASLLDSEITA